MDDTGLFQDDMDNEDMNYDYRSSPNLCGQDSWPDLHPIDLDGHFTNLQKLTSGRKSKIYRAMQKNSQKMLVLKCVYKKYTDKKNFMKEFNYSFFLRNHPNVLKSFKVSLNTDNYFVFGQEHAIGGDLSRMIVKGGLGESQTKKVTEQITYALDFLHRTGLVHRDICLENIFVFDNCLTNIKLGDFGQTEELGTIVTRENLRASWSPPEICELKQDEEYYTEDSSDSWQMGILIFVCLTGSSPWYVADCTDCYYDKWLKWISNENTKIPPRFKCFSTHLMDLFHCLLEPSQMLRGGCERLYEFLQEPWLIKEINCKDMTFYDSSSFVCVTSNESLSDNESSPDNKSSTDHKSISNNKTISNNKSLFDIPEETKVQDFLDFNSNETYDFTQTNTSYVTFGSHTHKGR